MTKYEEICGKYMKEYVENTREYEEIRGKCQEHIRFARCLAHDLSLMEKLGIFPNTTDSIQRKSSEIFQVPEHIYDGSRKKRRGLRKRQHATYHLLPHIFFIFIEYSYYIFIKNLDNSQIKTTTQQNSTIKILILLF